MANSIIDGDWEVVEKKDGTLKIVSYIGTKKKVTVPNILCEKKVTEIGKNTFKPVKCDNKEVRESISEVIFSEGITIVGESAFSGCKRLKKVSFCNTLKHIKKQAFEKCENIVEIILLNGIERIDEKAFFKCKKLEKIVIPDSIKYVGEMAFLECEKLFDITAEGNPEVGINAFSFVNKKQIKKVVVNNNNLLDGNIIIYKHFYGSASNEEIVKLPKDTICGEPWTEDPNLFQEIAYKEYDGETKILEKKDIVVGKTVEFGRFPIDLSLDLKPIKWRVLEELDGKALLLSEQALLSRSFVLPELYDFLNNDLIDISFNEKEKNIMEPYKNNKIFLLDDIQIEKYMPNSEDRISYVTEYCKLAGRNNFIRTYDKDNKAKWGLYCDGLESKNESMKIVGCDGNICVSNFFFNIAAVRIAIMIDLSKL